MSNGVHQQCQYSMNIRDGNPHTVIDPIRDYPQGTVHYDHDQHPTLILRQGTADPFHDVVFRLHLEIASDHSDYGIAVF